MATKDMVCRDNKYFQRAFTSYETLYEISTFPAYLDYKIRCSQIGQKSKASPCCLFSIVSRVHNLAPCVFGARFLWDSFSNYRDFQCDTQAIRFHWLCVPQAPTFFEYPYRMFLYNSRILLSDMYQ